MEQSPSVFRGGGAAGEGSETLFLLSTMVSLGAPIVLQNLIGSSLNMLDSVMIGSLGTARIAGVAVANRIFFVLNLFIYGVGSGSGTFVAQYWGAKDLRGIRRSLGLGLIFSMSGAVILFGVSQAIPRQLVALFSTDPDVIDAGARFLRLVSIGFLFQAVSNPLVFVLRGMGRTGMPLVASSISLAVNTLLNWILIFGQLGAPALGVEGSGLATATARLLELCLILAAMRGSRGVPRLFAGARLRDFFAFDRPFLKRFLAVILPVVGNETGWALGVAIEAAVYGRMSTDAIAAYNIADTAISLVMVVFFGVTNASAIIVGNRIGGGDAPGALRAARLYTVISPFLGVILGLVSAAASLVVPSLFNVNAEVRHWAMLAMIIFGAIMPLRMLNWEVIVGVLRAGGDTTFSLILDVGGTWLVGLPLCAAAGLLLHAPFWAVYLCALMEDVPKCFLGLWRVRSRRWLNDLTGR